MSRRILLFFIDLLILLGSFTLMLFLKPEPKNYLHKNYLFGLGLIFVTWMLTSFSFDKYTIERSVGLREIFRRILYSNFVTLAVISIFIVALQAGNYSRLMFFGTIGIATLAELILANIDYLLIHTVENAMDIKNPPLKPVDIKKASRAINFKEISVDSESIRQGIIDECGEEVFEFINSQIDLDDPHSLVLSTTTRFNIQLQPDNYYNKIVNLKRVNDIQYINKFFEAINRKLPKDGVFIGTVETKQLRKKRILNKYFPGLNWIMYTLDFTVKRVFPKFNLTKKIYFFLTRGENRVITRAETLGRLYSCGFEIVEEKFIGGLFFFVVKKIKEPVYDMDPTYGPFVKLQRVGKGGKIIKVYKLRTMHPYAEYLQDYIYQKNKLQEGGKFKDDFRVSTLGKIFRTFWLDELPMVFNFLKGDLKIVGVRPISKQYFDLYREEVKARRIKFKPGLVPPFYADLPKTLDEIQDSEMRYLEAYEKRPLRTDFVYFFRAFNNIFFKRARSG
ncbi:MAG: sugar transferase [Bacteroidales bacterium]|nr:sugar transferase [Bacteroidales bacterium]